MFLDSISILFQIAIFGFLTHQYVFPFCACAPGSDKELEASLAATKIFLGVLAFFILGYLSHQFWQRVSSSILFLLISGLMLILYRRYQQLLVFKERGHDTPLLNLKYEKTHHYMLYSNSKTGYLYRISYSYQASGKTYNGHSFIMGERFRDYKSVVFDPKSPGRHSPIGAH